MKQKGVILLLALATLAVSIQNVVFFRATTPEWVDAGRDESDESTEAEPAEPLAAVNIATLSDFLRSVPAPYGERSPFLSGNEADRLRSGISPRGDATGTPGPTLDGILWSPAHKVAWIDGQPVSEGDFAGGKRVERIASHAVVLRAGISQFELRLGTNEPAHAEPETLMINEDEEHEE